MYILAGQSAGRSTLGLSLEKEISTRCTGNRLSTMPASLQSAVSFATTIRPVFRLSPNRQYFMKVCRVSRERSARDLPIL